jgi:NTP pyrophosphatase (non-canonical NTP hydrolase)
MGEESHPPSLFPLPSSLRMTLDEYQRAAERTINPRLTDSERLVDAAAGLAEEAGEVLGLVRKHAYMRHPLDRGRLTRELGDALWCVATIATTLGVTLADVAAANMEKLGRRYPEGYSDEASRARPD